MSTTRTDELLSKGNGDLLERLARDGDQALAEAFLNCRDRLERMVDFRIDRRLARRIDPVDVLQEAYLEIARRIDAYRASPSVSFFVWARQVTWQTMLIVQRRHLAQKRHAGQDVPLHGPRFSDHTSFCLAEQFVEQLTSPSQAAIRKERFALLHEIIDQLDETDREILMLRHFEQLPNAEVAEILGLTATAASNRYVRALQRLRAAFESAPELRDELS